MSDRHSRKSRPKQSAEHAAQGRELLKGIAGHSVREVIRRSSTDSLIKLVMLLSGGAANPKVVQDIAEQIKSEK